MGQIRLLGDQVINRIAAGEVVERPASAVKELVENSLDAGARSISVQLQAGGKRLIRVTDDGCGMDRDDALLALERHATSKLSQLKDLDSIATLGFRGEALSSIAAVSRFKLETSQENGRGSRIIVNGGRIVSVAEAGLPRGSSIEIARLFFNVPARRKFMRSEATELSHVVRWLTRYSLTNMQVKFQLEQSGRYLIRVSPTTDRLQRIVQLFGQDLAQRLVPIGGEEQGLSITGFAGRPADATVRRDIQHVFVNGRAIQDRVLMHAVSTAYGNTVPRGRNTAIFLFLEIAPQRVDVNVHPQKTEVRFSQPSAVHDLVMEAVTAALSHGNVLPSYSQLRPSAAPSYAAATDLPAVTAPELNEPSLPPLTPPYRPGGSPPAEAPAADLFQSIQDPAAGITERQAGALAQYNESYILAEDKDGLILVDQHAAHERVIYERYLAAAEVNQVETQRLLFPVTIELSAHQFVLLEAELEEFRRLGFEIEPFGGTTVRVDGVPAPAADVEPAELLLELLGQASKAPSAVSEVGHLRRRLVTSAACQAAIKINHPLTQSAMQGLLDDLYQTVNPSTCPHGRPALFRLTLEEIERTFRRR